jgi:hypothetical protein
MMIRANVNAGDYVMTIDVTRQATGAYVARLSRIMTTAAVPGEARSRLRDVTVPVLIAEYPGETPGVALDRVCDGVRRALEPLPR